jgi:hypothetical protein
MQSFSRRPHHFLNWHSGNECLRRAITQRGQSWESLSSIYSSSQVSSIIGQHLFTTSYKPTIKTIKMRFFELVLVTVTALSIPAYACKCARGSLDDPSSTQSCCEFVNGNFQYGEDCEADSISEMLEAFSICCSNRNFPSDCDCPTC